jgi:hypothetical protein
MSARAKYFSFHHRQDVGTLIELGGIGFAVNDVRFVGGELGAWAAPDEGSGLAMFPDGVLE